MDRRNRYDLDSEERARREVVTTAQALIQGEVGVIEGSRRLSGLAHLVVDDWVADPDFRVFCALDSETDHLPVGKARDLWDPAVLAEKDADIQRFEALARLDIESACRRIIRRFTKV